MDTRHQPPMLRQRAGSCSNRCVSHTHIEFSVFALNRDYWFMGDRANWQKPQNVKSTIFVHTQGNWPLKS